MKHLVEILRETTPNQIIGATDWVVKSIEFDSRRVEAETLFVAVRGFNNDGHLYINQAIKAGARGILCETLPEHLADEVTYIEVADSSDAMGRLAASFYDHPSRDLQLVGVTGTNGKTSTVTLLHQLFTKMGYKVGLLSTVENRIGEQVLPATHTTPDAVSLNRLMSEMVATGCTYVFMEVSSHAVDQRRIAGLHFTGAVFTNITHDHLDYHKTFKAYIQAKKQFFDDLPKTAFALTNVDDRNGKVMVQNTAARIYQYSLQVLTDFKAKILDNTLLGLHLDIDGQEVFSRLIGNFNAYNLLAVYAVARLLDGESLEVLTTLSELRTAEGRFDYVYQSERRIAAIIDYAHTPDALEKVLGTIDKLKTGQGRVITVVGCGGDRDRSKRPIMAKVACDYSDQVILTSDNPRSEEPEAILAEMEAGIPAYARQKTLTISDRKQAIRTACTLAQTDDIILVAGKGHEKYQEIKGVKHPFDDKRILVAELGIKH